MLQVASQSVVAQAVGSEVLRLYPSLFMVLRRTTQATTIGDIAVPAHTNIAVSLDMVRASPPLHRHVKRVLLLHAYGHALCSLGYRTISLHGSGIRPYCNSERLQPTACHRMRLCDVRRRRARQQARQARTSILSSGWQMAARSPPP